MLIPGRRRACSRCTSWRSETISVKDSHFFRHLRPATRHPMGRILPYFKAEFGHSTIHLHVELFREFRSDLLIQCHKDTHKRKKNVWLNFVWFQTCSKPSPDLLKTDLHQPLIHQREGLQGTQVLQLSCSVKTAKWVIYQMYKYFIVYNT